MFVKYLVQEIYFKNSCFTKKEYPLQSIIKDKTCLLNF